MRASGQSVKVCPLRRRCLAAKAHRRDIYRWVHEDVIERHRARMTQADALMRRRGALAEHPFGTLKCRAGYRHFLVRGFDKVRGEWGLMALCYNFARVLSILGFDGFTDYLARQRAQWAILLVLSAVATAIRRARAHMARICAGMTQKSTIIGRHLNLAGCRS